MNGQHSSAYAVPVYDTTALTAALANPYAQHHASSYMSPHYYQAYMQVYANNPPRTTPDGYTLSSTYVPANQTSRATSTVLAPPQPSVQKHAPTTVKPISNHLTYGSWYQSGNCRCTRQGCPFTGSPKSVEIHMMDRHFIFPPGWEKKEDWDADPSLRGKPIAIHGTSVTLNTPEAIDAWIAERKRRFPTKEKIQEKKRKLEEAAARGQLTPADMGSGPRKKHRRDATIVEGDHKRIRGLRGHQRGRGRGLGRQQRRREDGHDSTSRPAQTRTHDTRQGSTLSGSTSDNDEAPEVVSSKAPSAPPPNMKNDIGNDGEPRTSKEYSQVILKNKSRPQRPVRNPFASRSTLLRNLLLPEIRITVSNLSQAIRFLVENDFLRDVELRPGEAQEQMIEVLDSSEASRLREPGPNGA